VLKASKKMEYTGKKLYFITAGTAVPSIKVVLSLDLVSLDVEIHYVSKQNLRQFILFRLFNHDRGLQI